MAVNVWPSGEKAAIDASKTPAVFSITAAWAAPAAQVAATALAAARRTLRMIYPVPAGETQDPSARSWRPSAAQQQAKARDGIGRASSRASQEVLKAGRRRRSGGEFFAQPAICAYLVGFGGRFGEGRRGGVQGLPRGRQVAAGEGDLGLGEVEVRAPVRVAGELGHGVAVDTGQAGRAGIDLAVGDQAGAPGVGHG